MTPPTIDKTADPADAGATAGQPGLTRIVVWDLPMRLFHWALAIAVSTAIATGLIGGDWMKVHGIAGLTIIGLLVFRLIWGFAGSTHARFASFFPTPSKVADYLKGRWQGAGHNPLGALSVFLLLTLLCIQASTGLFSNDDISFTGPLYDRISEELAEKLTGWHHRTAWVVIAFVGLHLLAIAFYTWIKKDKLVKPMVIGYKDVASGEPVRKGGWLAFVVAVLIAIGVVVLASGVNLRSQPAPAQSAPAQKAPAW
jgi:cytochrome b